MRIIETEKSSNASEMVCSDEYWMRLALDAAVAAASVGEVPVGAIAVSPSGHLLASAHNLTITQSDPTAHAEVLALRAASALAGNYRLTGSTLYTTVEPCVMCAGALLNARIARLVFGTHDERFGAVESQFRLCDSAVLNHRIEVVSGVMASESRALIQNFFSRRRTEIRSKRQTRR